VPITFTIGEQPLADLGRGAGPIAAFWLRLLADIDRRAKTKLSGQYFKVQTGNLRSSQQVPFVTYRGNTIIGVVQNTAVYAAPLHEGIAARTIVPKRVGWLTGWTYQGAPVFTKLVNQPARPGKPWLRDSVAEALKAAGVT
jgi:hypothetical protein